MVWFKVDDALATHDKVLAAGNAAMGLWVRAGAWSAQHLTDGHIPTHAVKLLGNMAQARALVTAGLWVEGPGDGFRFHEWGDYQPTKAHVEKVREGRRENGRKGGLRSGEVRSKTEATCLDSASTLLNTRPDPSRPVLVVTSPSQSSKPPVDDDGLTRIRQAIGPGCTERHARNTADFILAKTPTDVRNPVAYILKAIAEDPDAYRYRRGNPTRKTECPDHPGEWADHCRACLIDARLESGA